MGEWGGNIKAEWIHRAFRKNGSWKKMGAVTLPRSVPEFSGSNRTNDFRNSRGIGCRRTSDRNIDGTRSMQRSEDIRFAFLLVVVLVGFYVIGYSGCTS